MRKAWYTWQKILHNLLRLLTTTKLCMTGFSYWVKSNSTSQWLLASTKAHERINLLGITHEYLKCTSDSNYSRVVVLKQSLIYNSTAITHEQCISCVARAQHVNYLQNFSSHEELHAFFCKLGLEVYHTLNRWFLLIARGTEEAWAIVNQYSVKNWALNACH